MNDAMSRGGPERPERKPQRAIPVGYVKVVFRVEEDFEGYPPVAWEGVWTSKCGEDLYRLENIPFYAKSVALGDVVAAEERNGELFFVGVVEEGGHGTVRVLVHEEKDFDEVRRFLLGCGCELERGENNLLAADIKPGTNVKHLLGWLAEQETAGRISYDEGCKTW